MKTLVGFLTGVLLGVASLRLPAQTALDSTHVRGQRLLLDSARTALDSLRRWCNTNTSSPRYLRRVCGIALAAPDRRARVAEDLLLAPVFDSTASIQVLLGKVDLLLGDTTTVCAVFTTRSGAKGLLLLSQVTNDSVSTVRLTPNSDTTAAACLPVVQRAGILLTPGLAPRAGTWTARKLPPTPFRDWGDTIGGSRPHTHGRMNPATGW